MNQQDTKETIDLMYKAIDQLEYMKKLNDDKNWEDKKTDEMVFQTYTRSSISIIIGHQVAMIHTLIDMMEKQK